jgi:hypothetical protein
MKKLVKKVATKKPVSKKVVKKTTKPKSTKRVRKYANGGIGGDDEYNRNYKAMRDADKELTYLVSNAIPKELVYNKYIKGKGVDTMDNYYSGSPTGYANILGISAPFATDASMKQYRNDIDAFYKANPNIKPYVGKLPIKKASLETRPMEELKGMAKGGTKKYAKGGTKAKLGSGERFKALSTKIEKAYQKKGKSKSVAEKIGKATAAIIGMKKYGKAKMTKMAVKGRKGK